MTFMENGELAQLRLDTPSEVRNKAGLFLFLSYSPFTTVLEEQPGQLGKKRT